MKNYIYLLALFFLSACFDGNLLKLGWTKTKAKGLLNKVSIYKSLIVQDDSSMLVLDSDGGKWGGTLYRSKDIGKSWNIILEDTGEIATVATTKNRIFCATGKKLLPHAILFNDSAMLLVSMDGKSWKPGFARRDFFVRDLLTTKDGNALMVGRAISQEDWELIEYDAQKNNSKTLRHFPLTMGNPIMVGDELCFIAGHSLMRYSLSLDTIYEKSLPFTFQCFTIAGNNTDIFLSGSDDMVKIFGFNTRSGQLKEIKRFNNPNLIPMKISVYNDMLMLQLGKYMIYSPDYIYVKDLQTGNEYMENTSGPTLRPAIFYKTQCRAIGFNEIWMKDYKDVLQKRL